MNYLAVFAFSGGFSGAFSALSAAGTGGAVMLSNRLARRVCRAPGSVFTRRVSNRSTRFDSAGVSAAVGAGDRAVSIPSSARFSHFRSNAQWIPSSRHISRGFRFSAQMLNIACDFVSAL